MFRSQNPRFLLGDPSAGPHDDVLTIDKDESLASIIRKLSEYIEPKYPSGAAGLTVAPGVLSRSLRIPPTVLNR